MFFFTYRMKSESTTTSNGVSLTGWYKILTEFVQPFSRWNVRTDGQSSPVRIMQWVHNKELRLTTIR